MYAEKLIKQIKKEKKGPIKSKISVEELNRIEQVDEEKRKELEKKEREQKRIEEKKKQNEEKKRMEKKLYTKIKNKIKKISKKKILDDEDKSISKQLFSYIFFNGILLSTSIFSIIKFFDFSWFSLFWGIFGFGILLWYIENNLVNFIKSIIFRN